MDWKCTTRVLAALRPLRDILACLLVYHPPAFIYLLGTNYCRRACNGLRVCTVRAGLVSPGSAGFAGLQRALAGQVAVRLDVNASHVLLRTVTPATTSSRHLLSVSGCILELLPYHASDSYIHAMGCAHGDAAGVHLRRVGLMDECNKQCESLRPSS